MKCRSLLTLTWLIACFAAVACTTETKPPINSAPTPSTSVACCLSSPTPVVTPSPEQLIYKIKQLQKEYVRDSTSEEAGECFTDDDLTEFLGDKKTAEIVGRLQKDSDFKALLIAIKEMAPEKRADLLDRGLDTYRKTWLELHLNPKTAAADELRKGQTKAGMQAEKLIAKTVVDFVRERI